MPACVLFSGGMDSYLAWKLVAPDTALVFVNIAQPYFLKEMQATEAVCAAENVLPVILTGAPVGRDPLPSGIMLHRNMHLIATAASAGFNTIFLGVVAEEINSDKSVQFMHAMEHVLEVSNAPQYWNNDVETEYHVSSPIRGYTKTELVKLYVERGFDVSTLLKTVSCYDREVGHCGQCASCFKRYIALVNNNLYSENFRRDPMTWAAETGVLVKATNGTYRQRRAEEINRAVSKLRSAH